MNNRKIITIQFVQGVVTGRQLAAFLRDLIPGVLKKNKNTLVIIRKGPKFNNSSVQLQLSKFKIKVLFNVRYERRIYPTLWIIKEFKKKFRKEKKFSSA